MVFITILISTHKKHLKNIPYKGIIIINIFSEVERLGTKKNRFVYDIAVTALFTAVIAICAWITVNIPIGVVPFTMQTFGVLCAAGILGAKRGTAAVAVYILIGAVGLPVFSGFKGGIGSILGPTGGFILGFLLTALLVGFVVDKFGRKLLIIISAMIAGVLLCYTVGVVWFMFVYDSGKGLGGALMTCVVPFLIPDALKILAASIVVNRVSKHVQ